MGYASYSVDDRLTRSVSAGYHTKAASDIFTQSRERKAHESMLSKGIKVRECRDSAEHPNTVPIVLGLDVTGSMGRIPHDLIRDGLPKLMSNLIQKGVDDASLLFVAIGDHECDRFPLQAGQFESGDAELDMWLTRTFLEGGGGGNRGESYPLAWHFASRFTSTDAYEKRGQKGFLITVGDEPTLESFPANALKEIYGSSFAEQSQKLTAAEILADAQEKFEVFHIALRSSGEDKWKELLGQRYVRINDPALVPDTVIKIVLDNLQEVATTQPVTGSTPVTPSTPKERVEVETL